MTPAELAAYAELAEVSAQWKALADWEREQRLKAAVMPPGYKLPSQRGLVRRPGLVGGRGPRQCRAVPLPAAPTDWRRTIPGMPCPRANVQTDEEPFPLVKVKHLPPPPSTPRPIAFDPERPEDLPPAHDPGSLFTRALTWTLKSRR